MYSFIALLGKFFFFIFWLTSQLNSLHKIIVTAGDLRKFYIIFRSYAIVFNTANRHCYLIISFVLRMLQVEFILSVSFLFFFFSVNLSVIVGEVEFVVLLAPMYS